MTRPTRLPLALLLLATTTLGGCYRYTVHERDGSVRHLSKQEYERLMQRDNQSSVHVPNDL